MAMSENDPANWNGSVPKCALPCLGMSLRDIRLCFDYLDPGCYCDIGDGSPFRDGSNALSCISFDCSLKHPPGMARDSIPSFVARGH